VTTPTSDDAASHAKRATILRWALTLLVLGAATAGMYLVRGSLDKAHVALVYLLIVLAASAAGGRALGLAVAGLAFLAFDFFFLVPYLTFVIQNPLDWLVLFAFLVTSVVAAQLLYRANATAEEATARAIEVDRLAALGAETLNAANADEALHAIADVIRHSIAADECEIQLSGAQGVKAGGLVQWIVDHGASAVELTDGTVRIAHELPAPGSPLAGQRWESQPETVAAVRAVTRVDAPHALESVRNAIHGDSSADALGGRPAVRALALPLQVRERTVGVLRVASATELVLTPEQGRLLVALTYYAALGAERSRLVEAAERAEAERRVESLRSALLTAVSHDLRTPLTTIKGIAGEIRHGADAERAAIIESEADRLNKLVDDLLDLSRIHAGAVRPALAVNTIDDLLGASLRAASGILRARHIEIDAPDDALLAGTFDLTQTLRIVVNLLDNAAKYSSPNSPIDLRARRQRDRVIIEVMDRGPSVPEHERDRIFEPFYRPPGVPPDIRGHGLGLSIARGLAEAQGGAVRFAPRPGGGSIFALELPAADASILETAATLDANQR
jgi:two-component system, OmpR family, sensor histidine kinase KdpD